MLRSKVCQGVKCVEKESELGCKVYHSSLKQSVPKEKSVLGSKVWVSLHTFYATYDFFHNLILQSKILSSKL